MLVDVRVHDPASSPSCENNSSHDSNPLFWVPVWMQTIDPRRRVAQTKSPAWMAANQPSPRTSRCGRNAGRARRGPILANEYRESTVTADIAVRR
jgi:hypothetical protein